MPFLAGISSRRAVACDDVYNAALTTQREHSDPKEVSTHASARHKSKSRRRVTKQEMARLAVAALLLATTQAVDRSSSGPARTRGFAECTANPGCRRHLRNAAGVALVDGILRLEVSDQVQPPTFVTVAPPIAV